MSQILRSPPQRHHTAPADARKLPPPHDCDERLMMYWLGEWDVYAFDPMSEMHWYMTRREMFHLQLWHPQAQVSVLTSSALTAGQFELFPFQGWKARTQSWSEMVDLVSASLYLDLPRALTIDRTYHALRDEFTHSIPGARLPECRFL
jgi:hypothetical protein